MAVDNNPLRIWLANFVLLYTSLQQIRNPRVLTGTANVIRMSSSFERQLRQISQVFGSVAPTIPRPTTFGEWENAYVSLRANLSQIVKTLRIPLPQQLSLMREFSAIWMRNFAR